MRERERERERETYFAPDPLQGCNTWITWMAIPLDSLSVKLMAPYTTAPLPCSRQIM